jgi:hypothetical protein
VAQRRSSWVPSFLRHRNLIGAEAVLLVGALNQVVGERVVGLAIGHALRCSRASSVA